MQGVGSFRSAVAVLGGARSLRVLATAVLAALVALAMTSSSTAYIYIPEIDQGELNTHRDLRTASVPPSAEQLAAVERLGAVVRWNKFGTPQSLTRHGGFLATGLEAPDAASAARAFLDARKALFRLDSADDLEVVKSLARSARGHVVVLRQRFGGSPSADGYASVGLVESGQGVWNRT